MVYCSIDTETTGLISGKHQIIEFAAILEDSKNPQPFDSTPKFRRTVLNTKGEYLFSSYAANMNAAIIAEIADLENGIKVEYDSDGFFDNGYCYEPDLVAQFKAWLLSLGFKETSKGTLSVVSAGKNFKSFDEGFLRKCKDNQYGVEEDYLAMHGLTFHHRSIDPSNSFIDWNNDKVPPSTDQCKVRAGIQGAVTHRALDDAWDIILLLRKQYEVSDAGQV